MITGKELGEQAAYPSVQISKKCSVTPGLTKREVFAMAAMSSFITGSQHAINATDDCASIAVEQADRLLYELAKDRP
jgi:hypothetical protein